jgi:hypothetical protein
MLVVLVGLVAISAVTVLVQLVCFSDYERRKISSHLTEKGGSCSSLEEFHIASMRARVRV